MSFEGSAEVYNETMRETKNLNYLKLKEYLRKHPLSVTGMYLYIACWWHVIVDNEDNCTGSEELHRKSVANAFWKYQVEKELREELCVQEYIFNGKFGREKFMNEVDTKRATSIYPHAECSEECKKRGCIINADITIILIIIYIHRLW